MKWWYPETEQKSNLPYVAWMLFAMALTCLLIFSRCKSPEPARFLDQASPPKDYESWDPPRPLIMDEDGFVIDEDEEKGVKHKKKKHKKVQPKQNKPQKPNTLAPKTK